MVGQEAKTQLPHLPLHVEVIVKVHRDLSLRHITCGSSELVELLHARGRLGGARLGLPPHPFRLTPQRALCICGCCGLRSPPFLPQLQDQTITQCGASKVD